MYQRKIIGICGRKGSGKSALCDELVKWQYPQARRIPFAKALKEGLGAMGVPPGCLYLPDQKERPQALLGGRTGRYAMQTLGTEWGRDLMGEDFWVNMWHRQVEQEPFGVVIVDDIRFDQELEAVRSYPGALIVGIDRPGLPPLPPRWQFWKKVHRSERFDPRKHGLPILLNDSTPQALLDQFSMFDRPG